MDKIVSYLIGEPAIIDNLLHF